MVGSLTFGDQAIVTVGAGNSVQRVVSDIVPGAVSSGGSLCGGSTEDGGESAESRNEDGGELHYQ